jgi:hypothetical protein
MVVCEPTINRSAKQDDLSSCFFHSVPANLGDIVADDAAGDGRAKEHFRTINVQWIGQWGVWALVAVQRINKLRAVNTLNRSTPAASTTISLIINYLLARFNFLR